jgi:hypothetical protein
VHADPEKKNFEKKFASQRPSLSAASRNSIKCLQFTQGISLTNIIVSIKSKYTWRVSKNGLVRIMPLERNCTIGSHPKVIIR